MAEFKFNASAVEPMRTRSFEPLPPGPYDMIIVKSEVKSTKAGTGHYIELEMHVLGGEHSGRRHWERLNVNNPSKAAQDMAQAALGALVKACGFNNIEDTEQLHDLTFVAHVEIDRKDSTRNSIRGYDSSMPQVQAPPLPRPAAPPTAKTARPWA